MKKTTIDEDVRHSDIPPAGRGMTLRQAIDGIRDLMNHGGLREDAFVKFVELSRDAPARVCDIYREGDDVCDTRVS